MKYARHSIVLAAGLVASLALTSLPTLSAQADSPTAKLDPGFIPDTGQINRGFDPKVPGEASALRKIPTQAEARAALMSPDSPDMALGQGSPPAPPTTPAAETTGAGPSATGATDQPQPPTVQSQLQGPIGATLQTMPAKFSQRNDVLDRTPIMAWPLKIEQQQRQQLYQAVMADKTAPAKGADKLAPATQLSAAQALHDMHPLPQSVRGIAGLETLSYVKAKDKVLLVEPATRIVVDEIDAG